MNDRKHLIKPKRKGKKKELQLEDRIYPIRNSDKDGWTEHWYDGRNRLNLPHPWRFLGIARPSSGKSTVIKNIILRTVPKFKEILVYSFDKEATNEYDDIGATMLESFPSAKGWNRDKKRLLIIEDVNLKGMSNIDRSNLNRIMGFTSSHCNLSVAVTAQSCFDVDPPTRRMASVICLWKNHDMNSLYQMASRTGLKKEHVEFIFIYLIKGNHDFLMIDLSNGSKFPYRINGFKSITLQQLDDGVKLMKSQKN
jgi:hypothetical protein